MGTSAVVTVSTLVLLLQELVEDNFVEVLVQGELSNVSQAGSGHYYFTLKDKTSQIKCAMFRSHARALRFKPTDGLAVICRGRVSVYPQRGDLQLLVEGIEPEGVGQLQLAFDQLKTKLEREGLFLAQKKQPLPPFPKTIGIVTSPTGAAIRDILQVLQRRSAGVKILLAPTRVQGEGAAKEISEAIALLNRDGNSDVLIVGRGGGSREDLWPFNEEIVARAIAASKIPVISAVGHEVDTSISDLVADLRAPTPSAAAELVVQNRLELERHLDQLSLRLAGQMKSRLTLLKSHLGGLEKRLKAPVELLELQRLQLQQLVFRLEQGIHENISQKKNHLHLLCSRLDALSPLSVLTRGYAIVKHLKSGELVRGVRQIRIQDELQISFADGAVTATVTEIDTKEIK